MRRVNSFTEYRESIVDLCESVAESLLITVICIACVIPCLLGWVPDDEE